MIDNIFWFYLQSALFAYTCGSIPFGYLLVRIFKGTDVRESGSGNIGATNVARSGSKGLAIATLLLDAVKGAVPTWFYYRLLFVPYLDLANRAHSLLYELSVPSWAALFAVLGHMF